MKLGRYRLEICYKNILNICAHIFVYGQTNKWRDVYVYFLEPEVTILKTRSDTIIARLIIFSMLLKRRDTLKKKIYIKYWLFKARPWLYFEIGSNVGSHHDFVKVFVIFKLTKINDWVRIYLCSSNSRILSRCNTKRETKSCAFM